MSDYIITCAACAWLFSPVVAVVVECIREGRAAK